MSALFQNEDLVIVEEHGTIYLIPPLSAPRRLNLSASVIWRMLGRFESLNQVIEAYASQFNCSLEEASKDITVFITQMLKDGFLQTTAPVKRDDKGEQ